MKHVCLQERGHPDRGRVSSVGHSSQAADLEVHLPAADLRRTGALPGQAVSFPRLQEQR